MKFSLISMYICMCMGTLEIEVGAMGLMNDSLY